MRYLLLLPLVWAGWEFVRRYDDSRPRSYAFGLVGLPLTSPVVLMLMLDAWGWIAAVLMLGTIFSSAILFFRLFTSYPPVATRTRRAINRFSLLYSVLLAGIPMVCLAWMLMLAALIWAYSRDRNWLFWAITIASLAVLLFLISASIWTYRRCSRLLDQA